MSVNVTHPKKIEIKKFNWGEISWLVSGKLGNSETMTFGKVIIKVGHSNPRHLHSNCDEILHLLSGRVEHSVGDETFPMKAGDTISIPKGVLHHAKVIGKTDAIMVVAYSSPYREITER